MSMFEVDKEGLAKIQERKGKRFVPLELVQNAFDEPGVTEVSVDIQVSTQVRGYYCVTVSDNAPEGFQDMAHAYTLFAESKKKVNPEQRGRWNLGEKLVIAVCRHAEIRTTKGTVVFEDGARRHSRAKTAAGSVFSGEVRMTHAEAAEAIQAVRSVLVPEGIDLVLNGEAVDCREPVAEDHTVTLPTEIADAEGFLRRTKRKTSLRVYEPVGDERPHLYEMGIPVVELDCDWHVDVGQKIPLNMDRDNVTPAYLRQILTAVVNLMHGELDEDTAAKPWVGEALESPDIEPRAVRAVIEAKHGEGSVAFDPSDPEGSKIAVSQGRQVIYGGSYSSAQWGNIRAAGVLRPAGQVTPSPKPFHPDGDPLKTIPRSEWTAAHQRLVDYAEVVGFCLTGRDVNVVLADDGGWGFGGAFGGNTLTVNLWHRKGWLKDEFWESGKRCDLPTSWGLDKFLIHEFAHAKVSDHLSEDFHEECCKLGAKLALAIRQEAI